MGIKAETGLLQTAETKASFGKLCPDVFKKGRNRAILARAELML